MRIVAILPAYNEGPRIRKVIEVLSSYPGFDEVYVIDDGSSDDTFLQAMAARPAYPAKHSVVIHSSKENHGKGKAMQYAVEMSNPDVIFFCDADIIGLTHEMIDQTLEPVLAGRLDMMIAMRDRGMYWHLPLAIEAAAKLGGERALTRKLWDSVPARYKSGFMIETALNYAADRTTGFDFKIMPGLSQVIKEQKQGFFRGLVNRGKMIVDIIVAHIAIRLSK